MPRTRTYILLAILFLSLVSTSLPNTSVVRAQDATPPAPTPTPEPPLDPGDGDVTPPPDAEVSGILPMEPVPDSSAPEAMAFSAFAASDLEGNSIATDPQAEIRPAMVFNPSNQRYFVAWMDQGAPQQIRGRLLDAHGLPIGPAFTIAVSSVGDVFSPKLAYSPASNGYMVIWAERNGLVSVESYCLSNCFTYSLYRYNLYALPLAADGTPMQATPLLLSNQVTPFNFTEAAFDIVYNSNDDEFLVNWVHPLCQDE